MYQYTKPIDLPVLCDLDVGPCLKDTPMVPSFRPGDNTNIAALAIGPDTKSISDADIDALFLNQEANKTVKYVLGHTRQMADLPDEAILSADTWSRDTGCDFAFYSKDACLWKEEGSTFGYFAGDFRKCQWLEHWFQKVMKLHWGHITFFRRDVSQIPNLECDRPTLVEYPSKVLVYVRHKNKDSVVVASDTKMALRSASLAETHPDDDFQTIYESWVLGGCPSKDQILDLMIRDNDFFNWVDDHVQKLKGPSTSVNIFRQTSIFLSSLQPIEDQLTSILDSQDSFQEKKRRLGLLIGHQQRRHAMG
jgi:hypothetical protein